MDNKEINNTYNEFQEGKKKSVSIAKIQAISSVIIVISILIWAFSIHISTIDMIKVVDVVGNPLETKTVRADALKKSLISSHCERTVHFSNSFDRFTLKSNQASSYFLMNKKDADRLFLTFKNNGIYSDALQNGWTYTCKLQEMKSIVGDTPPYKVQFISHIKGELGDKTVKFLVKSEGEIDLFTPQYPENPYGYYFTKYEQTISRIQAD